MGRRGPHGHPGHQRRRADRPRGPHPVPAVRRRRGLVRGDRSGGPGWPTPTTSSPATSIAGRSVAGGRGPATGPGRRSTTPTGCRARCCCSRGRTTRWCPPTSPSGSPPSWPSTDVPCRLTRVRRGVPRLPPGRHHRGEPHRRARLLPSLFGAPGTPGRRPRVTRLWADRVCSLGRAAPVVDRPARPGGTLDRAERPPADAPWRLAVSRRYTGGTRIRLRSAEPSRFLQGLSPRMAGCLPLRLLGVLRRR